LNYKSSRSSIMFLIIYFLSSTVILFYFFYFFTLFFLFFIVISLYTLYIVFVCKQKFSLQSIKIYNYSLYSKKYNAFKYYFVDLLIQYAFVLLYFTIKIVYTRQLITFIKQLLGKTFNFVFIIIFGFPIFFIKLINKLYTRIDNSVKNNKININLLFININTMYIFDYQDSIKFEELSIYYTDNKINFT
jgi:hypothetical protein